MKAGKYGKKRSQPRVRRSVAPALSPVSSLPDMPGEILAAMLAMSQDHVFLVSAEGVVERYWGKADESVLIGPSLIGKPAISALNDEALSIARTAMRQAEGSTAPVRFEFRLPSEDGAYRYYESTVIRLASGRYLSVCRDVTSPLQAEESRRRSEEMLRHVTDTVPGGVYQYRLDADGNDSFIFASPGIGKLFGLPIRDSYPHLKELWAKIHPEDFAPLRLSVQESYQSLKPWTFEYRVRRNPGEDYRWIRGISKPLPPPGDGTVTWNGFLYDVTDQKALESHLIQAQKLESIGTLASGIAHDFNNVLLAIANSNDLAKKSLPANHEAQRPLETVAKACDHARKVVRSLLTFSRRSMAERKPVDLRKSLADLRDLVRRVAPPTVAVSEVVPDHFRAVVLGDQTHFQQVILNLVMNACDAMPEGGSLTIRLEPEPVSITHRNGAVTLTIEDTGVGIAPEHLDKIFEPFFTTKSRGEGTGLGLSVVHGIVNAHGGTIAVDSTPGNGTRFAVTLPLTAEEAFGGESNTALLPAGRLAPEADVLVAMDDATAMGIIRGQFTDIGVHSSGVATAGAAELIRKRAKPISAVVLGGKCPQRTLDNIAGACAAASPVIPLIVLAPGASTPPSKRWPGRVTHINKALNPVSLVRTVVELIARNQEPA